MGHERDLRKFDDEPKNYRDLARKQLDAEGQIEFCGTNDDFRRQEQKISRRAHEIKEREEYEILKKKYG